MVDVEYKPIQRIIVHEALKQSFDDFIRKQAVQRQPNMPPPTVRWAEGVIFTFAAMQVTPEMINERVRDGVVHWDFIIFAEMPEFQDIVTHPDTQVQLRVSDNTNNSAVSDVIRHFKNNPMFFPPGT